MTYDDLLRETAERKRKARADIKRALSGRAGFLAKAELDRDPGAVAWLWLAKDFCETLAEHIDEWMSDDPWDYRNRELADIYMAYEDGRSDLYELLPVEAQLFTD